MKLGIFDSGLGGLVIAKSIRDAMPDIDMVYLGDTMRLPYGNRSTEAIYNFTKRAMIKLFELNCALIVIACNTASAAALRKLQQTWLPYHYPGHNIIGVVVPTVEEALDHGHKKLGLIGTNYIVSSNVYKDELKKLNPGLELVQRATPLLVPLVESDGLMWADSVLRHYLMSMDEQEIECLMLGCTHYPFLKDHIRKILGVDFCLLSQDEIIPQKLQDYLNRHPEYSDLITRNGRSDFYVTDLTDNYSQTARVIYDDQITIQKVSI